MNRQLLTLHYPGMKQPVSYHPIFAHGTVAVPSDAVAVMEVEDVLGAMVTVTCGGRILLPKAITGVDMSSLELETARWTLELHCS
jgi:hypothetical protein